MSELTVWPDSHPESTSVDGGTANNNTHDTWTNRRNAAGSTAVDNSAASMTVAISTSHLTTNYWIRFSRAFLLFDTSDLGAGVTIDSAILKIVCITKGDAFGGLSHSLVSSNPASNTAIVAADHTTLGTTNLSADWTVDSLSAGSPYNYNEITLNAAGLAAISKTGITKFGIRVSADRTNSEPSWTTDTGATTYYANADNDIGNQYRPLLIIQYTSAFTAKVMVF